MKFSNLPLLTLCLASSVHSQTSLPLEDLFNVRKPGQTENPDVGYRLPLNRGACSAAQVSTIRDWVTDSSILVDKTLEMMQDYNRDAVVRKTLASFFQITPGDDPLQADAQSEPARVDLIKRYQNVQTFLRTAKFPKNADKLDDLSRLYCESNWAYRVQPDEQAREPDTGILDTRAQPGSKQRRPRLVRDRFENEDKKLYDKGKNNPFWSADHLEYIYEKKESGDNYCDDQSKLAGTNSEILPYTMTLCPQAFTNPRAVGPTLKSVTEPTVNMPLAARAPQSLTFLHELFHLVEGNMATRDYANTVDDCIAFSNPSTAAQVRESPECFVQFALAMWLTADAYPSGNRWTFSNGMARLSYHDENF